MLEFIPTWLWGVLLALGVFGLFFKNQFSNMLGRLGSPLGLQVSTTLMVISVIAILMGGFGAITSFTAGLTGGTASVLSSNKVVQKTDYIGDLKLEIHDGLSNATTTEDYQSDDELTMNVYSADASIADGEEYLFNISIERTDASYGGTALITCSAPDKEISGVTADSLVEKTGGEIDLDINDGGRHVSNTVVEKLVSFSAGTVTTEVEIAFDHEETYHDGMTDMDDTFEVTCTVDDMVDTLKSVNWVMKANS